MVNIAKQGKESACSMKTLLQSLTLLVTALQEFYISKKLTEKQNLSTKEP
jgi:hypothetical protein